MILQTKLIWNITVILSICNTQLHDEIRVMLSRAESELFNSDYHYGSEGRKERWTHDQPTPEKLDRGGIRADFHRRRLKADREGITINCFCTIRIIRFGAEFREVSIKRAASFGKFGGGVSEELVKESIERRRRDTRAKWLILHLQHTKQSKCESAFLPLYLFVRRTERKEQGRKLSARRHICLAWQKFLSGVW